MIHLKRLSLACAIAASSICYNTFAQTADNPLLQALTPVSDEMLRNPPAADWLNWRRTYDTYGFSPLDQINTDNAANLGEAWRVALQPGSNTPTPLVHDGVMFLLTTEDT